MIGKPATLTKEQLQDDKYDGLTFDIDDISYILEDQRDNDYKEMLQKFSIWLLRQANRDSKIRLRQTKAYELWMRFTQAHPLALPTEPKEK